MPSYARDPTITYFGGSGQDRWPLSNLSPCRIIHNGLTFGSSEHLYRVLKIHLAASYADGQLFHSLLADAESVRRTKGSLRAHFAAKAVEHKFPMETALQAKFMGAGATSIAARVELRNTGTSPLALMANQNGYWGLGPDGTGSNMLGYLLMKVRASLP